jgi:hypothetical protein
MRHLRLDDGVLVSLARALRVKTGYVKSRVGISRLGYSFVLHAAATLDAKGQDMPRFGFKSFVVAMIALLAVGVSSAARADEGTVRISFIKAGWVIGGSVGSGTLTFRGRTYPLSIGGLSWGLTFGGSQTNLHGRVTNIFRASDIEGVYGAAGAGATVIRGPQAIILTNQRGALMELSGRQTGLMVNLDLNGMAVSLRR